MADLDSIKFKLVQIFGEDNIDVNDKGTLIRFEEIDIINIEGTEHTIRGLYVTLKWECDKDGKIISFYNYMYGQRNIFTEAEIYSHYIHSHLSGFHPDEETDGEDEDGNEILSSLYIAAQDFCLGSDTVSQLLGGLNLNFDIDQFQILLNTIDEFVRWESLEGGPYILIRDIASSTNTLTEIQGTSTCPYDLITLELVYNDLKLEDLELEDYQHDKNSKTTFLNDSPDFRQKISNILSNLMIKHHLISSAYYYKDKYYLTNVGRRGISDYAQNVNIDFENFTFKGEVMGLEILPTKPQNDIYEEVMNKGSLVAHPSIVNRVMEEIEQDLNKFILKETKEWEIVK